MSKLPKHDDSQLPLSGITGGTNTKMVNDALPVHSERKSFQTLPGHTLVSDCQAPTMHESCTIFGAWYSPWDSPAPAAPAEQATPISMPSWFTQTLDQREQTLAGRPRWMDNFDWEMDEHDWDLNMLMDEVEVNRSKKTE